MSANHITEAEVQILSALAHPVRLGIIRQLVSGVMVVGDLVSELGVEQSQVSKQLATLRRVGLVRCSAAGRCRLYGISTIETIQNLLTALEDVARQVRQEAGASPSLM